MSQIKNIRNFAIIAHIDHGKSTLADRLIEQYTSINRRNMSDQLLDNMDLEKERGITIKSQTTRLEYHNPKDDQKYILNLIDTPGHVDFAYEVSRSLSAVEGSILLVDATQGIEAQTLATLYQAMEHDHEIIVALNKIDLPSADPMMVRQQLENIVGLDAEQIVEISAKTGQGVSDLIDLLIEKIPAPSGSNDNPLKTLLIDSWYDSYLGIIILIRVFDGQISSKTPIKMLSTGTNYVVDSLGIFTPFKEEKESLSSGEIGYIITGGLKNVSDCYIGDTITSVKSPITTPLSGFKKSKPMVFSGIYPIDNSEFEKLKTSIEKLSLNDPSFSFEIETSAALGFGFRCGFLGLLHLEIIQERLKREFDLHTITTSPSVIYKVTKNHGEVIEIHNPEQLPTLTEIKSIEEPWVKATIIVPDQYIGNIMSLCLDKRGEQLDMNSSDMTTIIEYKIPMNEVVFDFYNTLKSTSQGYASISWEQIGYEIADIVKLSILINGETIDALSALVHKNNALYRGKLLCQRLKDLIPRQMFSVAIQASLGAKIIARETISPLRKDVTAKCYGGDVSRKRKLLEKQKKGKKRMKTFGNIDIPSSTFTEVLKHKE